MNPRPSRAAVLIAIFAIGLIVFFLALYRPRHDFVVRAYFRDAGGLREGAPVRVSGFKVGSVRSIQLRFDPKTPVEVVMGLDPKYASKIPNDSKAQLATAGVLGETYVAIDIANAFGPPLQTNSVLRSVDGPDMQEVIKNFMEASSKKCPCADQSSTSPGTKSLASSSRSSMSKH